MMSDTIELAKQAGATFDKDGDEFPDYQVHMYTTELEAFRTLIEAPLTERIEELEAYVNALRLALSKYVDHEAAVIDVCMATDTLGEIPHQSLEAHDREVRNQKAREDIESISDEATVSLNIIEQLKKDTPDMVNDINRVIHIHAGLVKSMSVIEATIEKE